MGVRYVHTDDRNGGIQDPHMLLATLAACLCDSTTMLGHSVPFNRVRITDLA